MDTIAQVTYVPSDWGAVLMNVATFGLKLLGFAAILVVGFFVARALGGVLDKVLEKVGFDRMVERGGIRKALSKAGYDASTLMGKVVFYTLMLFVLQIAFSVFGPNPISDLLTRFIAFLPNILVAIALIVVAASIASAVRDIVMGSTGGLPYGPTLSTASYIGILVLGIFMALDQLNIAPEIVNGLFYAMLAIVAGSAIVAIGGGGIRPMEDRWRQAMGRVDREAANLRGEDLPMPAVPRKDQQGYVS